MIKQLKQFILFGAFFFAFLISCKKEADSVIKTQNQNTTDELKSLLNQVKELHDSAVSLTSKINTEYVIRSISIGEDDIIPPFIDWNMAFKSFDSANIKSLTVPISYNISTGELFQLVATSRNNSLNGYLVKQIPDSSYYSKHPDILDISGFTGKYIVYDLSGHFLTKVIFISGSVYSNSLNISQNGNIRSNQVSAPCETCDLLTVTVIGYIPSNGEVYNFLKSYYGYAIISLAGDDINYSTNVISGGGSIYNSTLSNLVSIPNGECVFGSLAYIGKLIQWDSNPNTYISQWANKKGLSLSDMIYKLDNFSKFRPNFYESISLLKDNYIVTPLTNNEAVINAVKKSQPVFVLTSWGDGNGHCVVLGWDNNKNSLYYYDSIDENRHYIEVGDDYYSTIKYFYAINGPKFEIL